MIRRSLGRLNIYDELSKAPQVDNLRQIADEILALRLKDLVVLQNKLQESLKEDAPRLPMPLGRATFPHPSLLFRFYCFVTKIL